MKNLHLLPTDKPSRLFKTNSDKLVFDKVNPPRVCKTAQNIYITSDEKTLSNNGDYYLSHPNYNTIHKWYMVGMHKNKQVWINKIILTTDQDLISEGVQAIDDEFLEWFVQNPSCEYVQSSDSSKDGFYNSLFIPQEEQTLKIGDDTNFGVITDIKDNSVCFGKNSKGIDIWYKKSSVTLKPKQETVEEAAERLIINPTLEDKQVFKEGAEWQEERMFNEKDMKQFAWQCVGNFLSNRDNEVEEKLVEVIIDRNNLEFEKFKKK